MPVAAAKPAAPAASAPAVKPLSQRPWDRFLVGWYAFALFFALMMDCLNSLAPVGKIDQTVLDTMIWPPKIMGRIFLWWCGLCDPVLLNNPAWYKVICTYSPAFHAPFYVAAIYCLVKGREHAPVLGIRIRDWALFWAGWMLAGVIPVFAESLGLPGAVYPSPQPLLFLAGYGSFIAAPIATAWRFGRSLDTFGDEKAKAA